jgi:hypothetical protein
VSAHPLGDGSRDNVTLTFVFREVCWCEDSDWWVVLCAVCGVVVCFCELLVTVYYSLIIVCIM